MPRNPADDGPPSDWLDNFTSLDELKLNPCEHCSGVGMVEVFTHIDSGYYKQKDGCMTCPDCGGTGTAQ